MPGGSIHGREPEPLDEILDCLAYADAVHAGDDEGALAAYDVVRLRLAGRADAMAAPLKLTRLILDEAGRQGCDVEALLEAVRTRLLTEKSPSRPSAAPSQGPDVL